MSSFGKIFESLVTKLLTCQLSHYVKYCQHVFMKGRSTSTSNVLEFDNFSVGKIEEGDQQVDDIYTDISKAFDRFWQSALVGNLSRIDVKSYGWIN